MVKKKLIFDLLSKNRHKYMFCEAFYECYFSLGLKRIVNI